MANTEVVKSIKKLTGGPLDSWFGPYDNVAAACDAIPNLVDPGSGINMRESKVVGIKIDGIIVDYYWKKTFTDSGLVKKVDLTPYVEKNLNPSGYYGPYENLNSALLAVPNITISGIPLRRGKIIGINTPDGIINYWWKKGLNDTDIELYLKFSLGPFTYKGSYDATLNDPVLSDATGKNGWSLNVIVAGSQNLGSGIITFVISDRVVHNGQKWERIPPEDTVITSSEETFIII